MNKKRDAKSFKLFNRTECDQVVARRAKVKILWRRRTKIAALEEETSNGNSNINSIILRKNKNSRLPSTSMLRHKSRQASRATINTIESIDSAAPPCGFLPLSLFDLIAIPLSLLLHFIPLSLSLLCPPIWAVLHHLYMYMVAFLALRILYVIALVCFVFVPCSPPESLPGKDVLCRLLPRPLPSVCFLFFSFLFRPCSPPICFGETSSIL